MYLSENCGSAPLQRNNLEDGMKNVQRKVNNEKGAIQLGRAFNIDKLSSHEL